MTLLLPYPTITEGEGAISADALQRNFDALALALSDLDSNVLADAGDVKMTARSSAPSGWLLCDGSAVSRTTYARLFTAISTTYGVGDGSTTFNLPDFRGRAPVGVGNGDATGHTSHTLGTKYGEQTHTLTSAESGVPAHTHPPGASSAFMYRVLSSSGLAGAGAAYGEMAAESAATGSNTAADASSAHENRGPRLTVNFVIKT